MQEDQRKTERSKVFLIAEFSPLHKRSVTAIGITNSFSISGISIEAQTHDLNLGDVLEISLKHPQMQDKVKVNGKVVWKRSGWYKYAFGIEFTDSDPETIDMLEELRDRLKHISPGMPFYNEKTIDSIPDRNASSETGKEIEAFFNAGQRQTDDVAEEAPLPASGSDKVKPDDDDNSGAGSGSDEVVDDETPSLPVSSPESALPQVGRPIAFKPKRTISRRIRRRSPAVVLAVVLLLSIAVVFFLPDEVTHLNGIFNRQSATAPSLDESSSDAAAPVETMQDNAADLPAVDNPPVAPASAVPFELPQASDDIDSVVKSDQPERLADVVNAEDSNTLGLTNNIAVKGANQSNINKRELLPEKKAAPVREIERVVQGRKADKQKQEARHVNASPKAHIAESKSASDSGSVRKSPAPVRESRKPTKSSVLKAKKQAIDKIVAQYKTKPVKVSQSQQKILKKSQKKSLPVSKIKAKHKPAEKKIKEIDTVPVKKKSSKVPMAVIQKTPPVDDVIRKASEKKMTGPDTSEPVRVTVKKKLAPGAALLAPPSENLNIEKSARKEAAPIHNQKEDSGKLKTVNKPVPVEKVKTEPSVRKMNRPVLNIALVVKRKKPVSEPSSSESSGPERWMKIGDASSGVDIFYDVYSMKKPARNMFEFSLKTLKGKSEFVDRVVIDCQKKKILHKENGSTDNPILPESQDQWIDVRPEGPQDLILDRICMIGQ